MTRSRCPSHVLILATLLLSLDAHCATTDKETDAQRDGLSGPVKSVSKIQHLSHVKPDPEPDVLSVLFWTPCADECDYDEYGNRTRSGEIVNSEFHGQSTRYVRDAAGNVIEQVQENDKGQPVHRVLLNRFGPTEEMTFVDGHWQTALLNHYDTKGNVVESQTFDPQGALSTRRDMVYDDAGLVLEEWDRGPETFLHFVHTYDRRTKLETWTNFHEDGSVGLTFTVLDNKVLSYWQPPGSKSEIGSAFFMDTGPKKRESRSYNSDGSFKRLETTFLDDHKRNARRIESYDEANELKAAADYEYAFDAFGNWVKRTAKVWTAGSGRSEVYEVVERKITFW
jgi:hypothetical protein